MLGGWTPNFHEIETKKLGETQCIAMSTPRCWPGKRDHEMFLFYAYVLNKFAIMENNIRDDLLKQVKKYGVPLEGESAKQTLEEFVLYGFQGFIARC